MEVSRRKLWLPMLGMARQALAGKKDADYLASKIGSILDNYRNKNDSLESYEEEFEEVFEEAIEGYQHEEDDQSEAMEGYDENQIKGPVYAGID